MISQFIDEDVFSYVEDFSSEREKFKDLVCYAEENRVPIVSQDVARFWEFLLKTIKPKNILEIGSAIGYSSLLMQNASGANIFTIEKDEDTFKILENNLKEYDKDNKIKFKEPKDYEINFRLLEDANIREFYEYQILSEDFELVKGYKGIEGFSFYLTYSIRENMGKSENNGPEIYSLHGEINIEDLWELILEIRWVFWLKNH